MLKKENRIAGKRNFNQIYRKGKVLKKGIVQIRALEIPGNSIQFAAVVPLAVSKKSTARNKLRREIYRIGKGLISKEIIRTGFRIVVSLKANPENHDLGKEIPDILYKLGCLKKLP